MARQEGRQRFIKKNQTRMSRRRSNPKPGKKLIPSDNHMEERRVAGMRGHTRKDRIPPGFPSGRHSKGAFGSGAPQKHPAPSVLPWPAWVTQQRVADVQQRR